MEELREWRRYSHYSTQGGRTETHHGANTLMKTALFPLVIASHVSSVSSVSLNPSAAFTWWIMAKMIIKRIVPCKTNMVAIQKMSDLCCNSCIFHCFGGSVTTMTMNLIRSMSVASCGLSLCYMTTVFMPRKNSLWNDAHKFNVSSASWTRSPPALNLARVIIWHESSIDTLWRISI